MRTRRFLWLFSLSVALILFSAYPGFSEVQPTPEAKRSIITHAFTVDKGYYGYIWRIYIEGEDPDGSMLRIASVVEQPGNGRYPTDWIYLKPQYQKHFRGYIQWNTFGSYAFYLPEWTQITLKVSVFDKAGKESNEVVFPFTFESGVKSPYEYTLPPPFDQGDNAKLGNVFINLYQIYPSGSQNPMPVAH